MGNPIEPEQIVYLTPARMTATYTNNKNERKFIHLTCYKPHKIYTGNAAALQYLTTDEIVNKVVPGVITN